jgi:hypothetical protein
MTEKDFRDTLPASTECEVCGRSVDRIEWIVGRYGSRQWFGLGIAKCEVCSVVRMAAAGSDDLAHSYASVQRRHFMKKIGQMH